jgi:uncharacterized repeat protein (TIGR01451 family)
VSISTSHPRFSFLLPAALALALIALLATAATLGGADRDELAAAWPPGRLAAAAAQSPEAPPATGGPDAYGYVYDSVPYTWTEISATGTRIAFNSPDDAVRVVNLPQTFWLYDSGSTSLSIATNGYASLRSPTVYTTCDPAKRQPPAGLAAFCADLTVTGGNVYYQSTTFGGHPAFIVQYQDVTHKASGLRATFQIILDFTDQSVTFQYRNTPAGGAGAAAVGIIGYAVNAQDYLMACAGAAGCQPTDGSALRFYAPPRPALRLEMTPSDFFPDPGDPLVYTLTLRNTGNLAAPAAAMTNSLPAGLDYTGGLAATAGVATYDAASREVRWRGDLAAGAIVTLTYAAGLSTADPIYNTAVFSHPLAAAPAGALSAPVDAWGAPELVAVPHFFDDNLASARHLAVDAAGAAHVAYGGNGLFYATRPANGAWLLETIVPTPTVRPALLLDAADLPVIAFSAGGNIMLARRVAASDTAPLSPQSWGASDTSPQSWGAGGAAGWRIEPIAAGGVGRIELAAGASGKLHLVFENNGALYYAAEGASGWSAPAQVITSTGCTTYAGFSLALDAADVPYLACVYRPISGNQRELRLFRGGATPWPAPEVIAANNEAKYYGDPSLAFTGGEFHLAFTRETSYVFYGRKAGGTWQIEQFAGGGGTLNDSYVSLDVRAGIVAVAYAFHKMPSPDYPTDIRLARRPVGGGAWTTENVESFAPGYDLPYPALALDAAGRGRLAYYHGADESLRYAAQTMVAVSSESSLQAVGWMAESDRLKPLLQSGVGQPSSSVIRRSSPLPDTPAAFTFQTVDRSETLRTAALAVGDDATVHLAYLAGGLRYAAHPAGAPGWSPQLVLPEADGTWLDLALSPAGAPHAAYAETGGPLYHATGPTGAQTAAAQDWTAAVVDQPGALQSSPAIAVDATAAPHIAYLALAGDGGRLLRHAALSAGHWHTETVATVGNATRTVPPPEIVALGGKVYLFYADCTAATATGTYTIPLRLAISSAAGWQTQTLDRFYGACDANLGIRLRAGEAGDLVAVAEIFSNSMRPIPFRRVFSLSPAGEVVSTVDASPGAGSDYAVILSYSCRADGTCPGKNTVPGTAGHSMTNWSRGFSRFDRLSDRPPEGSIPSAATVPGSGSTTELSLRRNSSEESPPYEVAPADVAAPLGPSYLYPITGLVGSRGSGIEYVSYDYRGAKFTTYQITKNGMTYTSASVPVYQGPSGGMTDFSPIHRNGLGRGGGIAAVTETFYGDPKGTGTVQMQITPPRRPPPPSANAVKQATPASPEAIYPGQPITYHLTMKWQGQEWAALTVADPYDWPSSAYNPNTLKWGAYIAQCQHDDQAHAVGCNGQFPPGGGETFVTFVVSSTCQMYDKKDQEILNRAAVTIDGFNFNPTASTREKTPFRLQTSTPTFMPQAQFQPGHTVLLYTVPKGDEPDCCTKCAFDLYVVVDGKDRFKMQNDGGGRLSRGNADFIGGDCHHSLWYEPKDNKPYTFDLYVVSQGQPFEEAVLADTLVLAPNAQPTLVALTDLRELFNEFDATDPQSPSRDRNNNCIRDFYEAAAWLRKYASDYRGVVVDVRQDAYDADLDYNVTAQRRYMPLQIDWLVGKIPAAQHRFTAIIGDDAVLPFFRYPMADEAVYQGTQSHNVPALLDTQAGYMLTDVPYSTRASEQLLPSSPRPDTALGRVFARRPVSVGAAQGFISMMDAYEQPLRIGGAVGSAYVFNIRNEVNAAGVVTFDWQASTQPYAQRLSAAGYINQVNTTNGAGQRGILGWLDAQAGMNWGPNQVGFVLDPLNRNRVTLLSSHASHLRNTTPNQRFTAAHVDANAAFPGALFMDLGCHGGYSTGVDTSAGAPNYYADALVRAALEHSLTYYGTTTYGQSTATAQMRYQDQKYLDFLDQLLGKSVTTGEAHRQATLAYYTTYPAAAHNWKDIEGLYATELYGLPTQPVHAYVPEPVRVSGIEAADAGSDGIAAAGALDLEFRATNLRAAAQGQYTLLEVPGGALAAVGDGPVIPLLAHTLDFPPGTAVTVSLVTSETAAFPAAVRLPLQQAGSQTFGVTTVPFTGAVPYPADPFWTTSYSDTSRVRLTVSVVPLRWNPVTGAVTQFRRMAFRISYSSPETGAAITGLAVNGGQPAQVGQAAIPVTMTFTAAAGTPLQLRWWVEGMDGKTRIGSAATITPTAGASTASWNIAGAGLGPGPMTLQVVLENADGAVAAAKWSPFTVVGRSLALTTDKATYRAGDASARLAADVRDENGAPVAGLAGQLQASLDGAPVAGLAWAGNGPYTATLALAPVAAGAHLLNVAAPNSLGGTAAFGIDRLPPTSAAVSPVVTHAAAFTVTVAGQDADSGVALYRLQYRVGPAGAWRDWLTTPAAWDFTTGEAPSLVWSFGGGQPVALRLGETYCFRSQATDGAGNVETAHAAADTCTQFTAPAYTYLPLVLRR